MKIFVTGDNHIGKKYANHSKKKEIVAKRTDALRRMVETANNEGCKLFAVTGDLFENTNNVAQKQIKAVVDALSDFNGTVAVIPGNHDYYDEKAEVWKAFKDCAADTDNILVTTEYKPYELDELDAVIYPAFCDKPHSEQGENRLGWIKKVKFPDDGKLLIGMAHGAVEGESLDREGEYFMMTREELNDIPVDIWLIGHTHVPFPNDLTEEFTARREKIFNAGTHVQTDVSNNTEGQCLIIEIDAQKSIRAKKYVSGGLRFYRKKVALTAGNMERELTDAVKDLGSNSVVEMIIGGSVSDEEYSDRDKIINGVLGRFLEYSYSDDGLTRLITKELVEKEFPAVSLAARLLNGLLDDPCEAQLAYDLINEIKEGK